jgi:phage/plasmid-associated DNA primase
MTMIDTTHIPLFIKPTAEEEAAWLAENDAIWRAELAAMNGHRPHDEPEDETTEESPNPAHNGHVSLARAAAEALIKRNIMPIPVAFGSKNGGSVLGLKWDEKRLGTDYGLEKFDPDPLNVGMMLGRVVDKNEQVLTDNFLDVDLDTRYAALAAPYYLPPTGMIWGRDGKPRSHWGYRLRSMNDAESQKFEVPAGIIPQPSGKIKKKNMICELRVSGYTLAPGSTNTEDGHPDLVRFESDGDKHPSKADYGTLGTAAEYIASVALMAEVWVEGKRHLMALPLSGLLAYGGMPQDDAERFVRVLCKITGETAEDTNHRLECVEATYSRAARNESYTGGKTLEAYTSKTVVTKLREWLHLKKQATGIQLYGPDGLPLASDGDGDRFVQKFGDRVIYSAREKQYYLFNGAFWEPDEKEQIRESAKTVAEDFRKQVADFFVTSATSFGIGGLAPLKQCTDWALGMGNTGRINAMLESGRSRPPIAVAPEDLDSNPLYFNLLNCTLEFDTRTGRVSSHAHRPEDFNTMIAPTIFDPIITLDDCALLQEYRTLFFPEDDRWDFLFEVAAEAITGLPKRNSLNLIGPHDAGKSFTLSLFANMLGIKNGYASSIRFTSLEENRYAGGDKPRADLWRIRRKRLVTIPEVPPNAVLDVALYKAMLGGGDIFAIRDTFAKSTEMHEVDWAVSLWFSGNRDYGPPPGEDAAFARSLPLRCDHAITSDKSNPQRQIETINDPKVRSCLLNLVIAGFERLYGKGNNGVLRPPDAVAQERADLQNRRDHWSGVIERLFVFTGNPDDGVIKEEAWFHAKTLRMQEMEVDRLPQHDRERDNFVESMTRTGRGREMRSMARFDNVRMFQCVRWSDWALEHCRVTKPGWV